MKKRIISLLLTLALLVTVFSGCREEETPANTAGKVTRGEWVSMLVEKLGLEHTEETPFYEDVPASDSLFPAVQSAAEWDILTVFSKNKLEPDRAITHDEVASTAAMAAGFHGEDGKGSVAYAVEQGIVSEDGPEYFTTEECAAILEKAYTVYLTAPGEEKAEAVTSKAVVDLSGSPLSVEGDTVTADGELDGTAAVIGGVTIKVGETFVTSPTDENPWGTAYKAIAIRESNGEIAITTERPTLADLYEELDVHTTVPADLERIIWADGVSVASAPETGEMATDSEPAVGLMSFGGETPKAVPMAQSAGYRQKWEITIRDGEVTRTWEPKNPGILGNSEQAKKFEDSSFAYDETPSTADFNGSKQPWEKKLELKNKFSAGYEIKGELEIEALSVTVDVQFNPSAGILPQSASLALSSKITSSLQLTGTLENKLKIGTVIIPLSVPGLSVPVDLYLYADLSGSLQVGAEFSQTAKVEWRDGDKLRKSQNSKFDVNTEAVVELDFGADLSASLNAFGWEIIDAGIKAGGNLEASAGVYGECEETTENETSLLHYKESMKLEANLYAPIITLYAGSEDSLLGQAGISAEWEILTKENAHAVPLGKWEWIFWEETVSLDENGEPVSSGSIDTSGVVLSNTYITEFAEMNDVPYPAFAFDYPDGWTISNEDNVNYSGLSSEIVKLTNERGVTVTYSHFPSTSPFKSGGSSVAMLEYTTSKIADSSFVPGYVQGTDHSDLGPFMVAKIQRLGKWNMMTSDYTKSENSGFTYAVVPETAIEEPLGSGRFPTTMEFAFWYSDFISMTADSPGGQFTEQEEREVIAILSSFRVLDMGEPSASESEIVLDHTYTTQFREKYPETVSSVSDDTLLCPPFSFDYPDGWTITHEGVSGGRGVPGEWIELSNDRGVTVSYGMEGGIMHMNVTEPRGYQNTCEAVITKVEDFNFALGEVQGIDLSDLEQFAIAKIEITDGKIAAGSSLSLEVFESGDTGYAILPNYAVDNPAYLSQSSLEFWDRYSFRMAFVAKSPDGQFTEQEEREVIAILSSFRRA